MQLKIKYERVEGLVPYARNAKKHDAKNVGEIARAIERFGFLDPVGVDAKGVIVWGHGRVLAAQMLGMATVPVIHLPPDMSEADVRALRIAHNKLAEKSGWDIDALRFELGELKDLDIDLSDTAFDDNELAGLLQDFDADFAQYNAPTQPAPRPSSVAVAEADDDGGEYVDDGGDDDVDGDAVTADAAPPAQPAPKVTDDAYSQFSLVMRHENKVRFVDTLDAIRREKELDKLEDALMELVNSYERAKDA